MSAGPSGRFYLQSRNHMLASLYRSLRAQVPRSRSQTKTAPLVALAELMRDLNDRSVRRYADTIVLWSTAEACAVEKTQAMAQQAINAHFKAKRYDDVIAICAAHRTKLERSTYCLAMAFKSAVLIESPDVASDILGLLLADRNLGIAAPTIRPFLHQLYLQVAKQGGTALLQLHRKLVACPTLRVGSEEHRILLQALAACSDSPYPLLCDTLEQMAENQVPIGAGAYTAALKIAGELPDAYLSGMLFGSMRHQGIAPQTRHICRMIEAFRKEKNTAAELDMYELRHQLQVPFDSRLWTLLTEQCTRPQWSCIGPLCKMPFNWLPTRPLIKHDAARVIRTYFLQEHVPFDTKFHILDHLRGIGTELSMQSYAAILRSIPLRQSFTADCLLYTLEMLTQSTHKVPKHIADEAYRLILLDDDKQAHAASLELIKSSGFRINAGTLVHALTHGRNTTSDAEMAVRIAYEMVTARALRPTPALLRAARRACTKHKLPKFKQEMERMKVLFNEA